MTAGGWPVPGEAVLVRGERWRVLHVSPHDGCAVVELAGAAAGNRGQTGRFILPFEAFERLRAGCADRPRAVRRAVWRRAARAAFATAVPSWWSLRAAARAGITLLAWQLEPVLAFTRGLASRVLLADEVGLGKTVQAGLIAAELLAREPEARVLVVTPAGLREQWREELRERFGIEAELIDAAALARAAAALPPGVNPWEAPRVAVTSIDFVKRPDVIRALEPLVWDLVAFDEAHGLAGRSDRSGAADLIARRARRVVAITATPHNGDDRAFDRLRGLGQLDAADEMVVFRRSRGGAGIARTRSVRRLLVRPAPAEAALHRALDAYARRVAREAPPDGSAPARLAMIVLARRACSSAASLARSAARRMSLLAGPDAPPGTQLRLPLDDTLLPDDDEPTEELAGRGLQDSGAERRALEHIVQLAAAVTRESKIEAVVRLLRRAGEPAIVFTQYRDTLHHLQAVLDARGGPAPRALLHGGMTAGERAAEARRFTHGETTVLLATDAASEGLNLHRRCRLVVNLDVPWTPLRLEQRVGRVDRLGQARRVHAIVLVARGTGDVGVAKALDVRAAHAADGAPFDGFTGLREEARAEAARLRTVRGLHQHSGRGAARGDRPVIAVARRRARSTLYLPLRFRFVDADGAVVWETIAGAALPCGAGPPRSGAALRAWFDEIARRHSPALASLAACVHEATLQELRADLARSVEPLARRERAIADALGAGQGRLAAPLVQAGLFDRQALRDAAAQRRVADEALARAAARLARLSRMQSVRAGDRQLAFAVVL
jgi:superfamily II DNA or RNA helicase